MDVIFNLEKENFSLCLFKDLYFLGGVGGGVLVITGQIIKSFLLLAECLNLDFAGVPAVFGGRHPGQV